MRTRKLLAATMLAALPLLVGALQSGPHVSEADAAGTTFGADTTYAAGRPSGPKALWWAGIEGEAALAAASGFLWNIGLAATVAL